MKRLFKFSLFVLLIMSITNLNAQDSNKIAKNESKKEKKELRKLEGNQVSTMSVNAFEQDFGNIPNVQWERTGYFDEASFTKDGIKMKAYYDANSTLVGTTTPKSFTDLPQIAQKEIKSKYKDFTVDKVFFFEDNENNDMNLFLYDIQFDDADNYFAELSNNSKSIVLQISPKGQVIFYKELHKTI